MTDLQVIDLAKDVAGDFGIKIDERLILKNIRARKRVAPVVVCNRLVTICIDRQCVKLCEHDDIDIIYIYVTKRYAEKELQMILTRLTNVISQNEFVVLSDIARQLRRALAYMERNDSDYYVFNGDMTC